MGENRNVPFAGLHNHSEYSNMRMHDSISKIEDMAKTALEFGYYGLVYTDHECLSSAVRVEELRDKYKENGLHIGFGNEIYLTEEKEIDDIDKFFHFLLIARTKKGYEYLKKLSSLAWGRSKFKKGIRRVPTFYSDFEKIVKTKGDLIAATACLGSYFATLVNNYIETNNYDDKRNIVKFLQWCISIFGEDYFYIEIQSSINEEQIIYNKKAIEIARALNIKVILTEDTHFLKKEDAIVHRSFVNSTSSNNNEDENQKDFYEGCYFKPESELRDRVKYLTDEEYEEFCSNTVKIIDSIETYTIKNPTEVPERPYPQSFEISNIFEPYYYKYEYIQKYATSDYYQDRFFFKQIEEGFVEKQLPFNDEYLSRIDTELDTLWYISNELNQRLSAYYSLVNYVMDLIWDEADSIIGCGRGSACGMLVCYLLNITQLDPVKYDLPYWRHLNKSRTELPDVDFDSEKRKRQGIIKKLKEKFGEDRVLGVATFRTESSKSAILTACRGMDIPLEDAQELADLIPIERGQPWSISDCMYGNKEEKTSISIFVKKMNENPELLEMVLKIEGLISGYGAHASGMLIFPKNYIEQGSLMYTPNGLSINCFELHDAEKCASLKFDLLTVENLDIIHETLNLLIDSNVIESQGNLRQNYNAYLHPDILDYETPEMFELLYKDDSVNVFQLSTDLAKRACKMLHPKSLKEMSLINSVMRLMGDGKTESPIEKYNRFKNDISLWYKEMEDFGLTINEQKVLEKYLIPSSGMAICQETVMLLSMDERISGFTMGEANTLRKSIAKKSPSLVEKSRELFYEKAKKLGTSNQMIDYVWNVQISLSLGYSFSDLHCMVYSCIALQQLNLLYHYPSIYSQCATLLVNSSSTEDNDAEKIDYGKVASAAFKAKRQGVLFTPSNVNKANKGYLPDGEKNIIYCGLKNIVGVNTELAETIIKNQPYNSINDFVERISPTKTQMINLIKSGSFDVFNPNRIEVMKKYLISIASKEVTFKEKLTGANLNNVLEMGLLPEEFKIYGRYYKFDKYITQKQFIVDKIKNKTWLIAKDIAFPFFERNYIPELTEEIDYKYTANGIVFNKSSYNKVYKRQMENVLSFINTEDFIHHYNSEALKKKFTELWEKYCKGSIQDWEFDSMAFYHKQHALANVNKVKYNISAFEELPEEPIVEEEYNYKDILCFKYRIGRICGTVLDSDRTKHMVTLLTSENEVVNVKFYAGAFMNYNKVIKEEVNGKSTIVENSWFSRGTKLAIVGYRNGDVFKPKKYKDSIYRHTVSLIEGINEKGDLTLRDLRYGEKENEWQGY